VIVPCDSADVIPPVKVVDSLSVIDDEEFRFLVKKSIDVIPTVNTIIYVAKIIIVLTVILHRFGWLRIKNGSLGTRGVKSLESSVSI
jgi:hypothetical protein